MKTVLNINRHLVYCILLIIFSAGACTQKFEEYNTDPSGFTDDDMDKDFMNAGGTFITQMQMHVFPVGDDKSNAYERMQCLIGDTYSGYFGANNSWGNNINGCTYYLLDDWNLVPFQQTFTHVMPAWKQVKTRAETENPAIYSVAQIIKVMAMHRTTDMYGPLPYFQFGHGGLTTPYDSQTDIYASFFKYLTDAVTVLEDYVAKYPTSKPLQKFDLVYAGDFVKWIRFANSLKLRLAMRISGVDPANAKLYAEQAVADQYGVLADNADNANLAPGGGVTFANPLKMIWDDYGDMRLGATLDSYMNGYSDPRLAAYFSKATYTGTGKRDYMGVRNGIEISPSNRTQYLDYSSPNIKESAPVQWMVAAEMYFLRAEGAIRGWNMGGTAADLYNQGIAVSFAQTNAGGASVYSDNSTATPAEYLDPVSSSYNIKKGSPLLGTITIKWDDAAVFNKKMERIITQKYIAMFPDGQEAWSEFRRTGFPKVFPVYKNNSSGTIDTNIQIRRIKYPVGEYNNNKSEVEKVLNNPAMLNGPDTGGTYLWWNVK